MHLSYYEVLGVDQGATAEEVKAAYQKLALNCHPDKAGDDSQGRFQELQQAWQVSSAGSDVSASSHASLVLLSPGLGWSIFRAPVHTFMRTCRQSHQPPSSGSTGQA